MFRQIIQYQNPIRAGVFRRCELVLVSFIKNFAVFRLTSSGDVPIGGKFFEGAATIADVYVNGQHLGQHRGAYTWFVFDATEALHPSSNTLAVRVDNDPKDYGDCLPSHNRLYTVWDGIYRKVWLVATDPLHIEPTDYASPGIFITPKIVSDNKADISIKVLLGNAFAETQKPGFV